jgi:hypothetical protein
MGQKTAENSFVFVPLDAKCKVMEMQTIPDDDRNDGVET